MRIRQIMDYLIYLVVRMFICVIQAMRIETCQRVARLLAVLANDVFRVRGDVVEDNIQRVYPTWTAAERRKLSRDMWEHLFLMVCELAHVPRKIHETNWRQYLKIQGRSELVRYLLDPRPLVIVSGHFGNFEMAAYTAGLLGFKTYAIARPFDNPYLHKYINQFRSSRGQYMITSWGSSRTVPDLLDAGQTLVLLGDQYAGPKGCWVNFLGRPASYYKSVAVFSLTAGAPMIVSYAKRLDRPLHFEVGLQGLLDPKIDELGGVKPVTEWYNQKLEELVYDEPAQYWWLHRRWKGEPPQRRRKQPAAEPPSRRVA